MAAKHYKLIDVITDDNQVDPNISRNFLLNFQEAMLLSLLEKKLLTQWQFDRCVVDIKKTLNEKLNATLQPTTELQEKTQ